MRACRYCPAMVAVGDICHFHRKTLRLVRQSRCVWCMRTRENDWPDPPGSYCRPCLISRIAQGGGERHRLNNAMSRVRATA